MTMSLEQIIDLIANVSTREIVARTDPNKVGYAKVIGFPRDLRPPVIIAIDMHEDAKKDMATAARNLLIQHGCDRYGHASECWYSTQDEVQPRLDPKRQDGLNVLAATADAVIMRGYIIRKIDHAPGIELFKVRELDSRKPDEGVAGRWAQLLAPQFDPMGRRGYFDREGYHFEEPKGW